MDVMTITQALITKAASQSTSSHLETCVTLKVLINLKMTTNSVSRK